MGNRKFNFNVDVYETFGGILENDFFFLLWFSVLIDQEVLNLKINELYNYWHFHC